MRKVTWVVSSGYMKRLEIFFAWLPKDKPEWLDEMVIVTNSVSEVKALTERVLPKYDFRIIKEQEIIKYPAYETRGGAYSSNHEALGHKMSAPLFLTPGSNMLYTDDDVVVTQNPSSLFIGGARHSWVGTTRMGDSPKEREFRAAYASIFGVRPLTAKEWNEKRTDGGAWYIPDFNVKEYGRLATEFFETVIPQLKLEGHRARMSDQWFMTMYLHSLGSKKFTGKEYSVLTNSMLGTLPNATLVHYAVHKKDKARFEDWLAVPTRTW